MSILYLCGSSRKRHSKLLGHDFLRSPLNHSQWAECKLSLTGPGGFFFLLCWRLKPWPPHARETLCLVSHIPQLSTLWSFLHIFQFVFPKAFHYGQVFSLLLHKLDFSLICRWLYINTYGRWRCVFPKMLLFCHLFFRYSSSCFQKNRQ